jgi:ABC-type uncharacterized transport system auxiliary subunit
MNRTRRHFPLIAAAAALLAACVSVLPEAGPAPSIYRLDENFNSGAPKLGSAVVEVALPLTSRALAGNRIAAVEAGGELVFISGARWEGPTPRIIQDSALVWLNTSSAIRAAVRPEDGVNSDYEIRLLIERFEFDRPSVEAIVAIHATLVRGADRGVVGSARFNREAPGQSATERSAVQALRAANELTMQDIRGWTVDAIAADQRRAR